MPLDASATFEPDLFNTATYARLHGPDLLVEWPGEAVFRAGHAGAGRFRSPIRAPYGGYEVAGEHRYEAFVRHAEAVMRSNGATEIEIGLPPLCYNRVNPQRLLALCRLGYRVTRQELNQAIPIPCGADARFGSHAARKSLAKAERAGVQVRILAPGELHPAHDTILRNRLKKGRTLSMTFEEVHALTVAFPHRVHVVGAEQKGRLLGAAITVAVNPRVLYVYAWGEGQGDETLSPVTSIAAFLLAYARTNGFVMLDLGTSSIDGIVDPGLVGFKRRLGALPSLKLRLTKALQ